MFVNRNRGSGTRLLLDNMLKEIASKRGEGFEEVVKNLRGYGNEVRSHMEVGVAVKEGKADCGIAIKSVAQKFIETLASKEFKDKILEKDIGINFFNETGKIIMKS
jgi:molybdate-binding protein